VLLAAHRTRFSGPCRRIPARFASADLVAWRVHTQCPNPLRGGVGVGGVVQRRAAIGSFAKNLGHLIFCESGTGRLAEAGTCADQKLPGDEPAPG